MLADLVPLPEFIAREVRYVGMLARVLRRLSGLRGDRPITIADALEGVIDAHPDRTAIVFEDRTLSYRELEEGANRYAHWANGLGIRKGDVVALLMENRPEYVLAWLGMAKLGVATSLLNTNLTGQQLAHCLKVAGARHLVLGAELASAWESARDSVDTPPAVWVTGGKVDEAADLDTALAAAGVSRPSRELRADVLAKDRLFFIYTSGTTGLPKAANFSHMRFFATAHAGATLAELSVDDRMYVCLPLYHTAGGVMAAGGALLSGAVVVIARRFSVSRFWEDCARTDVTAFQYIGELLRYLVNAPTHPDERRHRVRVCVGNGLRPEIWERFAERFGIPKIREFYGATEGNVALFNVDGKVGAVGRVPPWLQRLVGPYAVKYDVEKGEIVRGPDGFCVRCKPNETGEAIGWIPDSSFAPGSFEGYSDPEATERKVLRDVFRKGDRYFRTGDLLRVDENGYWYFVDRIGDTFRWKGENVSTQEVAEVLSRAPTVKEVNVYGVVVPGADGRAGMAAVVPDGDHLDLEALHRHASANLAPYARPLFVRIRAAGMDVTATLKHRKIDLVEEGYDPDRVEDALYFAEPGADRYVPLTREIHETIRTGKYRL